MFLNRKKILCILIFFFTFQNYSYSETISIKNVLPFNLDNTVNAFIEIPAGTIEKWEMSPDGKTFMQELEKNGPRKIDYLPYPINYGFIPQTLLSKSVGGDGDALDIVIIGPQIKRGSIVKVKVIGMIEMIDKGELDTKILSVLIKDELNISKVNSLKDLKKNYIGVLEIILIWFENYKQISLKTKNILGKQRSLEEIRLRHNDFLSEVENRN